MYVHKQNVIFAQEYLSNFGEIVHSNCVQCIFRSVDNEWFAHSPNETCKDEICLFVCLLFSALGKCLINALLLPGHKILFNLHRNRWICNKKFAGENRANGEKSAAADRVKLMNKFSCCRRFSRARIRFVHVTHMIFALFTIFRGSLSRVDGFHER